MIRNPSLTPLKAVVGKRMGEVELNSRLSFVEPTTAMRWKMPLPLNES